MMSQMPDIFTKEKRSEIMAKIRSKGSKMEIKLKSALEENHLKSEYQPKIFGNPDFLVMPNIAVFCDSSFWHGRDWSKLKHRLSEGYWYEHINHNRMRDRIVNRELKKQGYVVLRFWEEQIEKHPDKCIMKIHEALKTCNQHI